VARCTDAHAHTHARNAAATHANNTRRAHTRCRATQPPAPHRPVARPVKRFDVFTCAAATAWHAAASGRGGALWLSVADDVGGVAALALDHQDRV
jgi:hypothetical protein